MFDERFSPLLSPELRTKLLLTLASVFFIGGVVCVGMGVWWLFTVPQSASAMTAVSSCPDFVPEQDATSSDVDSSNVVVAITGGVVSPGMYQLAATARVGDLVKAAGGFSEQANAALLQQQVNLAGYLTDGEGIYIPQTEDETVAGLCTQLLASQTTSTETEATASKSVWASGLVSINTASQKELESLSGIGEKRAEAIMASRPYTQLSELVEREVLTEKLFSEIEKDISL